MTEAWALQDSVQPSDLFGRVSLISCRYKKSGGGSRTTASSDGRQGFVKKNGERESARARERGRERKRERESARESERESKRESERERERERESEQERERPARESSSRPPQRSQPDWRFMV